MTSNQAKKSTSGRIPEIDGLRAIALILVLLYHIKFTFLPVPGGFLGVDIFFVISGFVITRKIWFDLGNSTFRILDFYQSRVVRLFPSFFLTLVITAIFASVILLPDELSSFTSSYFSSFGLFSNHFFWRNTGYFDPSVDFVPLIHIWSLSVEEQYYLLFPFIIILLFKSRKSPKVALGLIFAITLFLYLALANRFPVATFYLLPFRIWEFVLGSIIAIVVQKRSNPAIVRNQYREPISILLLIVILALNIFYDRVSLDAQYTQLIVVSASAILLLVFSQTSYVNKFLNLKILQSIGLASYAIYLVHQPVLVLWRYGISGELSNLEKAICLIVTLILAYGMSIFVENPLRRMYANDAKNPKVLRGFMLSVLVSILVGALLTSGVGNFKKYSVEQNRILAFKASTNNLNYDYGRCFLGADNTVSDFDPNCLTKAGDGQGTLLIGDSHAAMISLGLKARTKYFSTISYTGCFASVPSQILPSHCNPIFEHDLEVIQELKPENILIAGNWLNGSLRTKFGEKELLASFAKTVKIIHQESPQSRIYIVGNSPQWSPDLPSLLVRKNIALKNGELVFSPDYASMKALDEKIKRLVAGEDAYFINLLENLCTTEGLCRAVGNYEGKLEPFVYDDSHTTNFGSALLATIIEKQLVGFAK